MCYVEEAVQEAENQEPHFHSPEVSSYDGNLVVLAASLPDVQIGFCVALRFF
jgi:hypothetical protein